jgi:hypothetical protein
VEDGKIEPFPLREKTAAVGMMFLGDTQDCEAALFNPFFRGFMPNWHVFAAARSPRGKIDEKDFLSPELGKRDRLTGIDLRQYKIRVCCSDLWRVGL